VAFFDTDPTILASVDDLLVALESEADLVQAQIDALGPISTPEQLELSRQLAQIDNQIDAINARLVGLVVIEASATPDERKAIASERSFLNQQLATLDAEKASLGDVPTPVLTVQDALLLATLQRRMELITSRYKGLYLRKLGVTGFGTVEPIVFADRTPEPGDPVVNAAMGLFGGLLIAVFVVVSLTRTRGTVWLPEDVAIPVLGEVSARKVIYNAAETWYDTAEHGPRKTAIQALRSAVEAQIPAEGATIAFTGHGVPAEGVQALAADLAVSMASAGSSVLLVDANFGAQSAMGEYKVGGASLSHVLDLDPDTPGFNSTVRQALEDAYLVRPGLCVVPSGPAPTSPGDALAGRQFRSLVGTAQEMYEVVIVVVDDIQTPSAQVAMQRLGYSILVITPGATTMPAINGLLSDVERLKISMLGAVFLGRHDRFVSFGRTPKMHEVRTPDEGQTEDTPQPQSPISRLRNYPIPDERRSAIVSQRSLSRLADEVGVAARCALRGRCP